MIFAWTESESECFYTLTDWRCSFRIFADWPQHRVYTHLGWTYHLTLFLFTNIDHCFLPLGQFRYNQNILTVDTQKAVLSSPADVVEGLWGGYDVEGGWNGASLLKVGDPQLGPGKLPLGVRLLLGGQSLALDQSDHPKNQTWDLLLAKVWKNSYGKVFWSH